MDMELPACICYKDHRWMLPIILQTLVDDGCHIHGKRISVEEMMERYGYEKKWKYIGINIKKMVQLQQSPMGSRIAIDRFFLNDPEWNSMYYFNG